MTPHRPRSSRLLPLVIMLIGAGPGALAAGPVPVAEPGGDTLELWPGGAPGAERVTAREVILERAPSGTLRDRMVEHTTRPLLTLYKPRGHRHGITLLFVPGGSYQRVVIDKEGFEAAEYFATQGFDTAVLRYRLPGDGWASGPDAPVHDAMRALRLLRARALRNKFGVVGYSAGGHLVARLITEPQLRYDARDAADALSARPDFAVLMYPVIMTTGQWAHPGSARQLLAGGVGGTELAKYSPDLNVSAAVPRTLIVHAADDATVPVENALRMYDALRRAGVRSELHVFDRGGHGFGLRSIAGKPVEAWPTLVANWALDETP